MTFARTAAVAAALVVAASAACRASRVALEPSQAGRLAAGWRRTTEPAPRDDRVVLHIALAHSEEARQWAASTLEAVSDPRSPSYGRYLSRDEVRAAVAPTDAAVEAVTRWVGGGAADDVTVHAHGDMVTAVTDVARAEKLLQAPFFVHRHDASGRVASRCESYTVPAELDGVVAFVGGTTRLPNLARGAGGARPPASYAAAKPPAAAADAAAAVPLLFPPEFVTVVAGDGVITAAYRVICADGAPATDPKNVCNGTFSRLEPHLNGELTLGAEQRGCEAHGAGVICWFAVGLQAPGLGGNYEPHSLAAAAVNTAGTPSNVSAAAQFPVFGTRMVTPDVLKRSYGVPAGLVGSGASNRSTQAVAEFLAQYYSPEDLDAFRAAMGLPPLADVAVVGPNNASAPGGEATLDIQYLMGVAGNVTTTFWSVGGLHEGQERFLTWLTDLQDADSPPLVHSVSYSDEMWTLSPAYVARINAELQKLGMMGLTILFCSLDDGVAGPSARGNQTAAQVFRPCYPTASPYATSVGATQFSTHALPVCDMPVDGAAPPSCTHVGERACQSDLGGVITSGGGFSDLDPRPPYQDAAVARFLATSPSLPNPEKFNSSGRSYPDISANGHSYLVVLGGELESIHGTSASTPVVAAILSLLNDRLLAAGKPPLGFVNPLLYSLADTHPQALRDVVVGSNECTAFTPPFTSCSEEAFTAQQGWDPVTGLGVPVFSEMALALGVGPV